MEGRKLIDLGVVDYNEVESYYGRPVTKIVRELLENNPHKILLPDEIDLSCEHVIAPLTPAELATFAAFSILVDKVENMKAKEVQDPSDDWSDELIRLVHKRHGLKDVFYGVLRCDTEDTRESSGYGIRVKDGVYIKIWRDKEDEKGQGAMLAALLCRR